MKRYSKWFLMVSVLFVALSVLPSLANAQPGDPGDDPDAPIDGGVSLLVAAGVGYGIKKAKDSRKAKASKSETTTTI